jgi:hypothetical protein
LHAFQRNSDRETGKSSNYCTQEEDDGGERRETEKELLRFTDGNSFVPSSITPALLETESISILQSTSIRCNAIEQREDLDKRWILLFLVLRFTT